MEGRVAGAEGFADVFAIGESQGVCAHSLALFWVSQLTRQMQSSGSRCNDLPARHPIAGPCKSRLIPDHVLPPELGDIQP